MQLHAGEGSALDRSERSTGNRLVECLNADARDALLARAEPVTLHPGQTLYQVGIPVTHVYFPTAGLVSIATAIRPSGAAIEVASVGREGVVGASAWLFDRAAVSVARVEIAGAALQLPLRLLREQAGQDGELSARLLRYMRARHVNLAYSAACNARHPLQARFARWLLAASDRCQDGDVWATHAAVGRLLGVRRAGITSAASAFKKAGLIRSEPGQVVVLDRAGLQAIACGCYAAIKAEYEAALAPLECSASAPRRERWGRFAARTHSS